MTDRGASEPLDVGGAGPAPALEGAVKWADHFDLSMRSESPRAKVILSACYVDELLRQLILLVLRPGPAVNDPLMDGPQAPFGSLSSKVEGVYRLALVDENVKTSLHLVRKIRNKFAHQLADCRFDDPAILAWTVELKKRNDHATPETRARFATGAEGDFEAAVSWLVFWLKHVIDSVPTACPHCGSEMEHRRKIQVAVPGHT